jgi:transposase
VLREQLARRQMLGFLANPPRCLPREKVGHRVGHRVRPIGPKFVKLYVKPTRTTPLTPRPSASGELAVNAFRCRQEREQQDVQVVHRVRQQLVKMRSALVNQVGGLLAEYVRNRTGIAHLRRALPSSLRISTTPCCVMHELLAEIGERPSCDERHRD